MGNGSLNDLYNSSLKKNTSGTKVNVKTEKDKTEESVMGNGSIKDIYNSSLKKNTSGTKEHVDSVVGRPENKETGKTENSDVHSAGKKKGSSGSKLHLDSKRNKKNNVKSGSNEKLQEQNTGTKKNASDADLNASAKNNRNHRKKKGSKTKPPEITEVQKNSIDGNINVEEKAYRAETKSARNGENSTVSSVSLKNNSSNYKKHGESKEAKSKDRSNDRKMDTSKNEELGSVVPGSSTVDSDLSQKLNNTHVTAPGKKYKKKKPSSG
ncbi:hypothetical protein AK88_03622 [Plasmodium fragile]|uniref:Uncharacterized protein n=1 Tax=Plasmodium fragile TaxID=5857 RepID=A0A0D9QI17_PLAFR|nr:uncharacterized protein AK88_03622 [Plasmodium fragile]KJP86710.1 hypothetical protein AK88_03622 [Plasmodium fragile]